MLYDPNEGCACIKNYYNSLYNISLTLYSRKGVEASVVWETDGQRQTDGERQDRFLYWPITSSLDHSTQYYLQDPT